MSKFTASDRDLVKIEKDEEKGRSIFKCLECGKLTSIDRHVCQLCGDLPVDDMNEHMLRVHNFDVGRWDAVTDLGPKKRDLRFDKLVA